MPIQAYASHSAKSALALFEYEPAPLRPHDVEVTISHCGVCHSDLHLLDGEWGGSYPMVCGHEVVGTITACGNAVDPSRMGQRVGIGWQRGACLACDYCLRGEENLCEANEATCNGHYGGFARAIRLDERFCHPLPNGLASETVAPLLCAGITVYAPLRRYQANAHTRVGVVGIGGLGHLALQFARAMGCHVTAFTTSERKAEEAQTLGAHQAVITTQAGALRRVSRTLDLLIVTVAADLNWYDYARTLRANGTMCFVGAASSTVNIPIGALVSRQWQITGGNIGGRALMREMLAFADTHRITAQTEVLPFHDVNTALDRLRQNDVRYRFVLAWD